MKININNTIIELNAMPKKFLIKKDFKIKNIYGKQNTIGLCKNKIKYTGLQ